MHLSPPLSAYARRSATHIIRPSRRVWARAYTSGPKNEPRKPLHQQLPSLTDVPPDPRPKWMFSTAALLRATLIPGGLLYAVFYHDFGQEDHVFMPPRRWLQRQKESFFTLSPEEKGLVKEVDVEDS